MARMTRAKTVSARVFAVVDAVRPSAAVNIKTMRIVWLAVAMMVLASGGGAPMSSAAKVELVDSIEGTSFLAISAALPSFEANQARLADYRIKVVRDGNTLIVVFTDKNDPGAVRGSAGKRPAFEVALDPKDLHVIRSNYVR